MTSLHKLAIGQSWQVGKRRLIRVKDPKGLRRLFTLEILREDGFFYPLRSFDVSLLDHLIIVELNNYWKGR